MTKRYIGLLLVSFISACTVGPDYQRPSKYSDADIGKSLNISDNKNKKITKNWYEEFQDKTLNSLIVCASTPFEPSITITAESAAIKVRYVSSEKSWCPGVSKMLIQYPS